MNKSNRKGFTLAELLIVVAIVAVLVAIAIPVFTAQKHKSEVVTDWANVRSYYAELQADYISTEKLNPIVPVDWSTNPKYDYDHLYNLNGEKTKLKAGKCAVSFNDKDGYSLFYYCNKDYYEHQLTLSSNRGA